MYLSCLCVPLWTLKNSSIMKKLIFTIAIALIGFLSFGQTASQLIPTSTLNPLPNTPPNFMWVNVADNRIKNTIADSVRLKYINIQWLNDSVVVIGDRRWVKLSGTYPNPSFISSLASTKVTGLANVATSGDYNDLSNKPNLSVYETVSNANATYYPLTNPSGYISSVPSQSFASLTGKPTTLSGYGITDAYPLTGNPSGFLTSQYVPTVTSGVTRPINSTTFTVSATKQAYVNYNVSISCTATIGSSASGSVALQISQNAGSSWTTIGTVSNSNAVTLAVALNSVQVSSLQVGGYIPVGALCRLVSTSSGPNGVITYLTGQETY